MKYLLIITLVLCSCSAQQRFNRLVANHPELNTEIDVDIELPKIDYSSTIKTDSLLKSTQDNPIVLKTAGDIQVTLYNCGEIFTIKVTRDKLKQKSKANVPIVYKEKKLRQWQIFLMSAGIMCIFYLLVKLIHYKP